MGSAREKLGTLIAWCGAMFVGSHWPGLQLDQLVGLSWDSLWFGVDKWFHVTCYAGLAILFARWWCRDGRAARAALVAVACLLPYAALDELSQWLVPGRSVALSDFAASAFGVGLGAALVPLLARHTPLFRAR
jgi:hypothetical protein